MWDHEQANKDADMRALTRCLICGKNLAKNRKHVDTCGERCFKRLLEAQRSGLKGKK